MAHSKKWRLAKLILDLWPLSLIVRNLYPIAVVSEYGPNIGQKISELKDNFSIIDLRPDLLRRVGNQSDGGYVVANIVTEKHSLLALGVGNDISFESELSSELSWINFYDHTVSRLPVDISNSTHHRIKIGPENVRGEISISQAMNGFNIDSPLILKIDIEGSEWLSLASLSEESLNKFEMIIGEFHGFLRINDIDFSILATQVLQSLGKYFYLFNSHANNWAKSEYISGAILPDVIEMSFIRKDLLAQEDFTPIKSTDLFNRPNNEDAPEIKVHHLSS
jgi:hypothetical protein